MFQFSPATIDDGSFRYKYSHSVDGYGRNAIQTGECPLVRVTQRLNKFKIGLTYDTQSIL